MTKLDHEKISKQELERKRRNKTDPLRGANRPIKRDPPARGYISRRKRKGRGPWFKRLGPDKEAGYAVYRGGEFLGYVRRKPKWPDKWQCKARLKNSIWRGSYGKRKNAGDALLHYVKLRRADGRQ